MIISVQTDKMVILLLKQLIITFLKYVVSKIAFFSGKKVVSVFFVVFTFCYQNERNITCMVFTYAD